MTTTTHQRLLYAAYGFLLLTGVLHFFIDVVHQYLGGHRAPGPATTYYYGLHSAYSLGQVTFALVALMVIRSGWDLMSRVPGQALSLLAVAGWFAICVLFVEYMPPRIILVIGFALLVAAAATARTSVRPKN